MASDESKKKSWDEMTAAERLQYVKDNPDEFENWLQAGNNVFIRTVTHAFIGKLGRIVEDHNGGWIAFNLSEAAWMASTGSDDKGRYGNFLRDGVAPSSEIEVYPGPCLVSWAVIVDIAPWYHEVPKKSQ